MLFRFSLYGFLKNQQYYEPFIVLAFLQMGLNYTLIGLLIAFREMMVNIMEMLERLAYYGVRVVIPIYIAQADEVGGLHFSQVDKGIIFLWWAVVQSLIVRQIRRRSSSPFSSASAMSSG